MVRPIVCDWDAGSHLPGTSRNSGMWRDLLADCDEFLPPVVLNRRLGELIPAALTAVTSATWAAGEVPLLLGGDHRLTYSALTAAAHHFPHLCVHQFDAHHDHHAAPSLTNYSFMRAVTERIGFDVVRHGCREEGAPPVPVRVPDAEVYLTIDVDYFDPKWFASVNYPIEVTDHGQYDLATLTQTVHTIAASARVIGADIVEWCADRATEAEIATIRQLLTTLSTVLGAASHAR
ncbi:MAG TPA: arginase family protein [Natronosporangium sp.]|nr:arginase family protein [Natronosporangium sp.]